MSTPAGSATVKQMVEGRELELSARLTVLVVPGSTDPSGTAVKITPTAIPALVVGKTQKLAAETTPKNAALKALTWSVLEQTPQAGLAADTPVAKVDAAGKVTALNPGSAVIRLRIVDMLDRESTATATIQVVQPVKGVQVLLPAGIKTLRMATGGNIADTCSLDVAVSPADASNKTLKFTSSNTGLVAVDPQTGLLTANTDGKTGTATITVRSEDGNKKATVKVTVVLPAKTLAIAPQIELGTGLAKGDKVKMVPTFNGGLSFQPTNKKLVWSSSDTAVATVDGNGAVRAVAAGSATVTATSADDPQVQATYVLNVVSPVTHVAINQQNFTLPAAQSARLGLTLNRGEAVSGGVTTYNWAYSSSVKGQTLNIENADTASPTISATPAQKTVFTLTVTVQTGTAKAQKDSVKVTILPAGASSNYSAVTGLAWPAKNNPPNVLDVGKTFTPKPDFAPKNPGNQNIDWRIESGAQYVRLNPATGQVTAVAPSGQDSIILMGTAHDPASSSVTISHTFKTVQQPRSVSLTHNRATLDIASRKLSLGATVLPANTSNPAIVWSSSNPAVASVDVNGVVTGLKQGTANITATVEGTRTATSCRVTVVQQVLSIEFGTKTAKVTQKDLGYGQSFQPRLLFNGGLNTPKNTKVNWVAADYPTGYQLAGDATLDAAAALPPGSVVTLNGKTGSVKATGDGFAVITALATRDDGSTVQGSLRVDVTVKPTAIKLNAGSFTLWWDTAAAEGGTAWVGAQVTPGMDRLSDGHDALSWKVGDPQVLAIRSGQGNGRVEVQALKPGKSTLSVFSADGKQSAKITITVAAGAARVQGIRLNESAVFLKTGRSATLKTTLLPQKPATGQVSWEVVAAYDETGRLVENTDGILTVSDGGKVTARGTGRALVRVTTLEGGHSDTCVVYCTAW